MIQKLKVLLIICRVFILKFIQQKKEDSIIHFGDRKAQKRAAIK